MRAARTTLAIWLAVFALTAQTLVFAGHGPFRVLAAADGGLVICTAEGLKRVGGERPGSTPQPADHACTACVTLAGTAVPPGAAAMADRAFGWQPHSPLPGDTPAPVAATYGRAQPRAPPAAA